LQGAPCRQNRIHAAARKSAKVRPSGRKPIPLIVAAITLAVVAGVAAILLSSLSARPIGDRRTLADLRPGGRCRPDR
jgi:hypothetical protein